MNYGFLINNETCIGCHACSTACKSENEVPLGVNRTWVKSVEKGVYPNVTRSFQVTRCNHCANPPCVRICPVTAMYQREDGIVEFDQDVCIGCKACLQACPYDAIYIDPDSGTAAKCHYCAHRVDLGLEPACVVVCPEHAILAGDLDNPETEIAKTVAQNKVTVRKPEQGTAPKLFYIGGDDAAMHPTAVERTPATFAWADVLPVGGDGSNESRAPVAANEDAQHIRSGKRTPGTQSVPSTGPITIGEARMAEQMTQVVYNAQHQIPWHWQVPAYLVTKGIASGIFIILAVLLGLNQVPLHTPSFVSSGLISLLFLIATTALLVFDLERPERFLRILKRPQWKSWLTRGAYLLVTFSLVLTGWWVLELYAFRGWMESDLIDRWRPILLWGGLPLAVGSAIYTAFLFGQAEGRDLWQNPLLPVQMFVQAVTAGAAALCVIYAAGFLSEEIAEVSVSIFAVGVGLNLVVTMLGEFGVKPASEAAARAAHEITHGRYAVLFWVGAIVFGHLVPLGLYLTGGTLAQAIAAGAFVVGLYLYEHAFVTAPQEIPNS